MKRPIILILMLVLAWPVAASAGPQVDNWEMALSHKKNADQLLHADHFKEAIDEYKKALDRNPRSGATWFNLAIAYFQSGRLSDAAACLERVLEIDPQDTEVMFNLGCLRLRERRMDDAERYFQQCENHKELAFKTRSTQAIGWIRELKAADPSDQEAMLMLLQRLAVLAPGF